ncbi:MULTISPECIES: hypothetical protein [unclassified Streptomyces]|uniref:hypothetical protein n=1 Tax=unclassified Streptomyces TaxID=2593676 RepID=UPI00093D3DAC|nr:hypothetical protein [Streptomyces sp. CB02058]OKI97452.1 hypothetical protein AMK10_00995 [Streptomyces sp. CB02058]
MPELTRRSLLRSTAALAALSAVPLTSLPAAAHGSAGTAPSWSAQPLPFADANLVGAVHLGRGRTWAAGFTLRLEGKATRFTPVVAERASADGEWIPVGAATEAASTVSSRVNAIDAAGPDDVWLVGDDTSVLDGRIYTQHYDGTRWSVVPAGLPEKAEAASLLGVDTGPGGTWAVGFAQIEVSRVWNEEKGVWITESRQAGIARRFDGTVWRDVPLPEVPGDSWYLNSVRAVSPDDVWAAGYDGDSGGPLLMHYDGTSWSRATAPGVTDRPGFAHALAVTPGGEVWLVGEDWSPADGTTRALVARRTGGTWRRAAVPGADARLFCVTPAPGRGIVVVGQTLGERREAIAWQWDPAAPSDTAGSRWTALGLPQPAGTDLSENSAHAVIGDRAGLTVLGTSVADGAAPQPFAAFRSSVR